MATLKLEQVRERNLGFSNNGTPGAKYDLGDIQDTILEDLKQSKCGKALQLSRKGYQNQNTGKWVPGENVSFCKILKQRYGLYPPEGETDMWTLNAFLRQIGVKPNSYSFSDLAEHLGMETLTPRSMEEFISSDDIVDHRFIVREVFMEAIRLGYLNQSNHRNWIVREQPMGDKDVTLPQIRKGEGTPKLLGERDSIPFGSMHFGSKKITAHKVGVGVQITDEIVQRSSINMVAEFLQTVGEDMGLAADVMGIDVLVNGEQNNNSENAPVVGVEDTTAGFQWLDIKRVTSRMRRLGNVPGIGLTQEDDGLAISTIPELQGFSGETRLSNLRSILGVPPVLQHYIHGNLPANQAMFLAANRAMVKLNYQGMMTERQRNPRNQEEEIFITDHIGFAIVRRDARVLVDKSLDFASNGFPSFMDIASFQNNPFRED